jgi:hypothetical protein
MLSGFFIALLSGRKYFIISAIVSLDFRDAFPWVPFGKSWCFDPPLNPEMVISTTNYTTNGWNRHIHPHNMYRNTNRKWCPYRLVKGGDSDDPDDHGFLAKNKF